MKAEKLKRFRVKLGMTQAEVAEWLGYSVGHISKWERGEEAIPVWMDILQAALRLQTKEELRCLRNQRSSYYRSQE